LENLNNLATQLPDWFFYLFLVLNSGLYSYLSEYRNTVFELSKEATGYKDSVITKYMFTPWYSIWFVLKVLLYVTTLYTLYIAHGIGEIITFMIISVIVNSLISIYAGFTIRSSLVDTVRNTLYKKHSKLSTRHPDYWEAKAAMLTIYDNAALARKETENFIKSFEEKYNSDNKNDNKT